MVVCKHIKHKNKQFSMPTTTHPFSNHIALPPNICLRHSRRGRLDKAACSGPRWRCEDVHLVAGDKHLNSVHKTGIFYISINVNDREEKEEGREREMR